MIPIEEGVRFRLFGESSIFSIHKVERDEIQVINCGEVITYTRKEFSEINNKNLTQIK